MSEGVFDQPWLTPPPFAGPIEVLDLDEDLSEAEVVEPDAYGRLRVRDKDTGHVLTLSAVGAAHGNYVVLDEPASDATGSPLPPEHHRFPVEPTNSGPEAENEEKDNG